MNIDKLFDMMAKERDQLEDALYATIEGNEDECKYVYDENTRKRLKKELKIIDNTLNYFDKQIDTII